MRSGAEKLTLLMDRHLHEFFQITEILFDLLFGDPRPRCSSYAFVSPLSRPLILAALRRLSVEILPNPSFYKFGAALAHTGLLLFLNGLISRIDPRLLYDAFLKQAEYGGMSQEIEAAIAREQERLARLLDMTRAGKVPAAPISETIPELLAQIREAIDKIEIAVSEEFAARPG